MFRRYRKLRWSGIKIYKEKKGRKTPIYFITNGKNCELKSFFKSNSIQFRRFINGEQIRTDKDEWKFSRSERGEFRRKNSDRMIY
jgi:hypothetical protein